MELAVLDELAVEPRPFLLDARLGWRAATLDRLDVHGERHALQLRGDPGAGRRLDEASGALGGLTDPTGIAVDRWGVIYVADRHRSTIARFDPCCGAFVPLPCVGGEGSAPRQLREPRGLAVTRCDLLVVVDGGNRRLQAFQLGTWALVGVWPVDASSTWDPFDVAEAADGTLLVTDRANGLVHRVSAAGTPLGSWDGSGPGATALVEPTHVAVDRLGTVYVVDDGPGAVRRFDAEGRPLGVVASAEELRGRVRPAVVATDAAGNLYVAGSAPGACHRVVAYACPPAGTEVAVTAGGCASPVEARALAFDPSGHPLVAAEGGVRVLEACAFERDGSFVTEPLDSRMPGCRWHLVRLSGSLPDLAAVEVRTHTAEVAPTPDEVAALADPDWHLAGRWTGPAEGTWDCLVQSPPGRHLVLRLRFLGSGRVTPMVDAAEVVFPRRTSAEHLPAAWRASPPAAQFLDRFVSIFDTVAGSVEGTVDDLARYVDPEATPAGEGRDFLTWLASWFGLAHRFAVPDTVLRALVANAADLYRRKGTPGGLRALVRILLGLDPESDVPVPGLLEGFHLRRWAFLGTGSLGDCTTLWGARIEDRLAVGEHSTIGEVRLLDTPDPWRDPLHHHAHRLTVFVPAAKCGTATATTTVQRAVELFAPAHVAVDVEPVAPGFRVGVQSTIGVDAAIGRHPDGFELAGESRLGAAVLQGESPPTRPSYRIGHQSVIGSSAM